MMVQHDGRGGALVFAGNGVGKAAGVACAVEWLDEGGLVHRFESGDAVVADVAERGGRRHLTFAPPGGPQVLWEVGAHGGAVVTRVSVRNTTGRAIRLRALDPLVIRFAKGAALDIGCALCHAWMLGHARVCRDIQPVFIWEELYRRSVFSTEGVCCVYHATTGAGLTLGFMGGRSFFGHFRLEFDVADPLLLRAFCDGEDRRVDAGETVASERLWVEIGPSARQSLDRYASATAVAMHAPHRFSAPSGWSTWDFYFGDIGEDSILENVRFLRDNRSRFPVEYIQIDAGYTDACYEWARWTARFPHGPAWLARQIRRHGFKPGLWLVLFFVHTKSRLVREHPDWIVRDPQGKGLPGGHGYALDGSHPEVQAWLERLGRLIAKDWGYEYIKIDGASAIGITRGVRYDPRATSCEAYRKGIEAFRRGMGRETFFMGGVLWPGIGAVDAMRVGDDVGARWDWSKTNVHAGERDRYHGSGMVKRCIMSALNSCYMHGRFWINDADYLVARDDRSELTADEARTWASILGLYGGTVILSDRMRTLSPERLAIAEKVFPLYGRAATVVDLLKRRIPEVLALDVANRSERWKIVGVFNYDDKPAVRTLEMKELGLDPRRGYHAHEFWKRNYLGVFTGRLSVALDAHACGVFALRRDRRAPQLVGTDIHLTQGGVELRDARWSRNGRLRLVLQSEGRKEGNLFVAVPEPWTLQGITPSRVVTEREMKDGVLRVKASYAGRQTLTLAFRRQNASRSGASRKGSTT